MELLAGDRLGKYEVVRRLAAGGMAEVYLARSLGHGGFYKVVALKRMLPELASEPGFREMFMQEAAVAARLNHQNIVQIFDFAEERGELYLAMEFVHGVNLRRLQTDALKRAESQPELRLAPLLVAHIGRCVARALACAWQTPDEQGRPFHLIHRDVSPHNLLLSYEGDVKLADFGIARPAERRTSVGVLKGKLLYMAPEQLLGGVLDARTDLFALGLVLYEASLGLRKPIFEAGNEDQVKEAVRSRLIAPPNRRDPDFPKALSAVIAKALERDPERRFQSAAELADALGEVIHQEAKSPLDCDLASYLRRLYGDPPPVPGLRAAPPAAPCRPESLPAAVADCAPVPSELELRGNDPFAATVPRQQADELRAAPAAGKPDAPAGEQRPRSGWRFGGPQGVSHGMRRRIFGAVAGLALLAAGVAGRSWLAARDVAGRASHVEAPATPVTPVAASVALTAASDTASPGPGRPSDARAGVRPGAGDAGVAPPLAPVDSRTAASPKQAERTEPAAPGTAPVARKAEKRRAGTVVVHAKPWAFVWIDDEAFTGNREQEAAPLLRRTLSAGRHVVHLQAPSGSKRSVPVLVQPGRELKLEESFAATP